MDIFLQKESQSEFVHYFTMTTVRGWGWGQKTETDNMILTHLLWAQYWKIPVRLQLRQSEWLPFLKHNRS